MRENPRLTARELYRRAMRVGFDHIGSMVNVLVLAYAAGAIPNMLLLHRDSKLVWQKVNGEGFASKITMVLLGSTCLLLAAPLSRWLAALLLREKRDACPTTENRTTGGAGGAAA